MFAQRRLAPFLAASLALPVSVLVPAVAQAMEAHEIGRNVDAVVAADGHATFTESITLDVVYGPVERLTFSGAPDATPTVHVERLAATPAGPPSTGEATSAPPLATPPAAEIARTLGRDGEARFVVKFPKKSGLSRGNYRIAISWTVDLSHLVHRNGGRTTLSLSGLVHEQSVDDAHFTVHTPDFGAPSVGNTEGFAAKVAVDREGAGYKLELGRAHISRGERFSAPLVFGAGAFPSIAMTTTDGAKDDAEAPPAEPTESPMIAPEVATRPLAASPSVPRGALPFAVALPLAFAALLAAKMRTFSATSAVNVGTRWLIAGAAFGGAAFAAAIFAFIEERDAVAALLLGSALAPLALCGRFLKKTVSRVRGAGEWLAVVDAEVMTAPRPWEPNSPLVRALSVVTVLAAFGLAGTLFARDARLAAAVVSFATPFLVALRSFGRDRVAPRERHVEILADARKNVASVAGPLSVRATLLARYPLGSEAWDDLRLLVTAKDTLPGLRSIEAGLLRDEADEAVPLAEVHVRVFAGSEAHERLLARYGAGFAPGRIPEERVLRLRAGRPGADALAETLATVARALVERRERRPVTAPVAAPLAAPASERRRPRAILRRTASSRGDSLPGAAAIG